MRFQLRVIGTIGVAACLTLGAALAGQAQTSGTKPVIPETAGTLEGVPTVRVDTTKEGARRRQLTGEEAAQSALKIKVVDGKYYWESRGNRPLTVTSSGEYTYLATEPGAVRPASEARRQDRVRRACRQGVGERDVLGRAADRPQEVTSRSARNRRGRRFARDAPGSRRRGRVTTRPSWCSWRPEPVPRSPPSAPSPRLEPAAECSLRERRRRTSP